MQFKVHGYSLTQVSERNKIKNKKRHKNHLVILSLKLIYEFNLRKSWCKIKIHSVTKAKNTFKFQFTFIWSKHIFHQINGKRERKKNKRKKS